MSASSSFFLKRWTMTAKPSAPTPAVSFEPEFMAVLQHLTEELIPFNQVLGLKLQGATATTATATLEMKPEL